MLVGRSAACAQIETFLAGARSRRSVAVLVHGGPGIGKSALLGFARERAGDMAVLDAQGVESESELPYAGLSQLLAPVIGQSERLVDRQRRALAGALGFGDGQPRRERFMVYLATLSLLAQAAEERPVLALVDDVHWLDAASAEALSFVAGRLGSEGIALFLTARDGSHAGLRARRLATIELEGVDVEAAAALLEEVAPVPVPRSVVETLHRQTTGVPLALLELARLLGAGQLAGSEPLPDPLPAGPELERAFGARIAALPDEAQRALLVAAAHDGSDLQPLARAWHARGMDVAALAEAETAGLVTVAGGQLQFAHPLLRSVAYSRAPAPQRRDAHAALAGAFARSGRARLRRAWHLAAAASEPDEEVARELEAVAHDAHRRAAPATAGRALEGAARVSPTPARRDDRLLSAARARITSRVTRRRPYGSWMRPTRRPTTRWCGRTSSTSALRSRPCAARRRTRAPCSSPRPTESSPWIGRALRRCCWRPPRPRSRSANRARRSGSRSGRSRWRNRRADPWRWWRL